MKGLSTPIGRLRVAVRVLHRIARRRRRRPPPNVGGPVHQVVHVSPAYFDAQSLIGGGERYALSLARSMAEHVPTRMVTFGDRRGSFEAGALRVDVYPAATFVSGNRWDPVAYRFLRELAAADVVHAHQYGTAVTALTVLTAAALGKRVFVSDYGGTGFDCSDIAPLARYVESFLTVSAFSGQMLPPGRPIHAIFGGVDEGLFRSIERPPGEAVLFVGRILPHKGIDVLVEALPHDMALDVVGRVYHESYYELLQKLAGPKRVRFHTDASDADVADAYRGALVTVLPSVYVDVYGVTRAMPELLGLVLLESMACGTPVICSAVGGMPEIVEDGVTGFVVPPNDPLALRGRLELLRRDPDLRGRMGRAGRDRVLREFTWDQIARRCLQLYGGVEGARSV